MKTLIVVGLLALCVLGVSGVAAEPTCQDLAGQGYACHEVVADPEGGSVSASVLVVIAPDLP